MDYETIYAIIIGWAPSISAIIASLVSLIAFAKNFKTLKDEIKRKTEAEEVKAKLEQCLKDNQELKKLLKEELTFQTKIERRR